MNLIEEIVYTEDRGRETYRKQDSGGESRGLIPRWVLG